MLVGDTSVGKSCLITNYLRNTYSDEYEPTVLDVYRGTKNIKGKQVEIELHDTSGDEHLGVNRKVQYQDADCFMICVACNALSSFESIELQLFGARSPRGMAASLDEHAHFSLYDLSEHGRCISLKFEEKTRHVQ